MTEFELVMWLTVIGVVSSIDNEVLATEVRSFVQQPINEPIAYFRPNLSYRAKIRMNEIISVSIVTV